MRIAVLGVGLIGGSVGLAARERLDAEVVGYDPDSAALALAARRGAVTRVEADLPAALAGAEVAVCAAPVGTLPGLVGRTLAAAGPDCVVTDTGSVKAGLVDAVADPRFVAGHPLAGAETAGAGRARADLFDGATWYLTPGPHADPALRDRLADRLTGLGARVEVVDAAAHDRRMAAVSHLPHVLANLLVARAAAALAADGSAGWATGPGFRDATRVAGAPSSVWTDIYLANRAALLDELDATRDALGDARELLAAADPAAVAAWNDAAAADRRTLRDAEEAR